LEVGCFVVRQREEERDVNLWLWFPAAKVVELVVNVAAVMHCLRDWVG
jgi:hypothetical protein